MKRALVLGMVVLVVLVLAGCTAGLNEAMDSPNEDGVVAGFWLGLWHGVIAPVTFVISLFSDTVRMYEIHNNGGWYDFGFMLGFGAFWGGGGGGAATARHRSKAR